MASAQNFEAGTTPAPFSIGFWNFVWH